MWIYDLKLNEEELNIFIYHIWELDRTTIDYYYFKGNCSFHLLSLIEVAKPNLKLVDDYNFVTIPIDTIKLIDRLGLIENTRFSPSKVGLIKQKYKLLTNNEKNL